MVSRSTQVHRLVGELEKIAEVSIDAAYGERAHRWTLSYSNGPTHATMQAHLAKLAKKTGLDAALFDLHRIVQDGALSLQAVRYVRTVRAEDPYEYKFTLGWAIEKAAQDTDHPDRPLDDREAVLAARLLAAEDGYATPRALAERLLRHGLAGLLADDLDHSRPGDRIWAAEYLTARYAEGEHRAAWDLHLHPMPTPEALRAAAADPDSPRVRVAALTLAPVVRAELEAQLADLDRLELGLITAVRADKAAWSTVGDALHITKQGASQRADRLAERASSTSN